MCGIFTWVRARGGVRGIFVSASPTWSDCSWAHHCNQLRRDVPDFRSGTAHSRAPSLGLSSDKWRPPSCQLRRSAVQRVNAITSTLGGSCVVKRTYHPSKLESRWWRHLDRLVDLGSWRKGCVRMQQNKRLVNEWLARIPESESEPKPKPEPEPEPEPEPDPEHPTPP